MTLVFEACGKTEQLFGTFGHMRANSNPHSNQNQDFHSNQAITTIFSVSVLLVLLVLRINLSKPDSLCVKTVCSLGTTLLIPPGPPRQWT